MKAVLAGFWALMRKYEAAYESSDMDAALRYGEELLEYCTKYQKELNFSDENMADWRKITDAYKNSIAEAKMIEADLAEVRQRRKTLESGYLKKAAQADKDKKIKWN
jgi:hypothetical protein